MRKFNKKIVKLIKFWLKRIGKERLFALIVVLFAAISFLVVVENDFDGETWDIGNALLYAQEARANKVSLIDYLNEKFPQGNVATNIYEKNVVFIPLWQSLVYSGFRLFRSISFSVRFWLAIIGFSTVVALYLIGKAIYNQRAGVIAAITLAASMYYVGHVKSGFGYYAIMPLLVLLLFYFFYLAHQRNEKKFLYLSGVIIFLLLFNGWPTMMLAAQIMGVFILINFRFKNIPRLVRAPKTIWSKSIDGKGKSKLLGLKDYLLMLLIGGGLFFVFGILYAWYFRAPPFDVFEKIYIFWYSSRATWFTHRMFLDKEKFLVNVGNLIKSLFWKMPFKETDGYLTTLTTPNYPMLSPFISIFLLIGVIFLLKRRQLFDKLGLIWLFFQILGTTILAGFTARNWLFAAPCLALVTGVGLNQVIEVLKTKAKREFYLGKILIGVIIIVFAYSIVSAYHYYFFYFVKHNSFLARAAQQAEVARYVTSVAAPENSLIVFDSFNPLPKDAFYFFTSGRGYETIYYWPEVINAIKEHSPKNLAKWEQEVLARKEKIVYLISEANYSHFSRGIKMWGPSDLSSFKSIHADLPPDRVIYYANGVPATKIYVVTREQPPLDEKEFKLKKNSGSYFWLDEEGRVDFLELTGPATNSKIYLNDNSLSLFPIMRLEEELKLGRNHSQINFIPLLTPDDSELVIDRRENIKIDQEDDSLFITSTAPTGYVIYKIRNLAPIKHVLFQTYPRINNDEEGRNRLTMQFSEDGRRYKTIYQLKSNKGRYWEWPYLKVATHGVKAASKEVYIKFIFEGKTGEAQLWSRPSNLTRFTAIGEGWLDEGLKLKKGLNKIGFEAEEGGLELTVATKEKMSEVKAFALTDQKERQSPPLLQLEEGLYRLWLGTKAPQEVKYEFIDFYLKEKRLVKISQFIPKEKELTLDFWAIVLNEKILSASDFVGNAGVVVSDPLTISQKAVYAQAKWTDKKDLIDKNVGLKKGGYFLKLLARLKSDERKEVAQLVISSVTRSQTLETISISGRDFQNEEKYQEFIAGFEVSDPREIVNFKIKFLGESKLWLDKIELISVMETVEVETLSRGSGSEVVEDEDASGEKAIFESLDASKVGGYVFFGDPKIELEAGSYLAVYRMKVADNQVKKSVVRIDNASQNFNYASQDIWTSEFDKPGKYQYFSLPLNNFSPSLPLEFRGIWYPKSSELWVDKIEVGKMIKKYQVEDLLWGEMVVDDPGAEGGRAILVRSENEAKGKLVDGLVYHITSQNFRVALRMKTSAGLKKQAIAIFDIYEIPGGDKIGETIIKKTDFTRAGQYQTIWLDVKRDSKGPIGFELDFLGESDVWLDYLDFVPLD